MLHHPRIECLAHASVVALVNIWHLLTRQTLLPVGTYLPAAATPSNAIMAHLFSPRMLWTGP
jgi:hypothetical protein